VIGDPNDQMQQPVICWRHDTPGWKVSSDISMLICPVLRFLGRSASHEPCRAAPAGSRMQPFSGGGLRRRLTRCLSRAEVRRLDEESLSWEVKVPNNLSWPFRSVLSQASMHFGGYSRRCVLSRVRICGARSTFRSSLGGLGVHPCGSHA
jgi:hypothetical protein